MKVTTKDHEVELQAYSKWQKCRKKNHMLQISALINGGGILSELNLQNVKSEIETQWCPNINLIVWYLYYCFRKKTYAIGTNFVVKIRTTRS